LVDDNAGIEDDAFPDTPQDVKEDVKPEEQTENAPAPQMDTALPDTFSEDDVIPLDNGLISPAEPTPAPTPAPKAKAPKMPRSKINHKGEPFPAAPDAEDPFSLGLPEETSANPLPDTDQAAPEPSDPQAQSADESSPLLGTPDTPVKTADPTDKFAQGVLAKLDNDLFGQMSDIEKQTTLLTLELRREKIRSEIEAVKAQRDKAEQEKLAAEEEKKRKDIEWQKEQEAKVVREQQILKEKEIELEKLKQRKMLNSYMNQMLAQNQKWIEENAELHKQMRQVEADRRKLAEDFKAKLDELITLSNKLDQNAITAKSNHDRTVASLTAQNTQLKKRIEADALAAKEREKKAAAVAADGSVVQTSVDGQIAQVNLAKEYAIMEITGKGDNLAARLINKDGETFMATVGTMLSTGHMVDKITERYIQFDKNGLKDYLYTSGSAIGMEPQKLEGTATMSQSAKPAPVAPQAPSVPSGAEDGVPSLGTGMFVK
jgi:hypothetical protein